MSELNYPSNSGTPCIWIPGASNKVPINRFKNFKMDANVFKRDNLAIMNLDGPHMPSIAFQVRPTYVSGEDDGI